MHHLLKNYGYVRDTLPSELIASLKKECDGAEENNIGFATGLSEAYPQTSDHYRWVEENKSSLFNFVDGLIGEYEKAFDYIEGWKLLDNNLPCVFGIPWINIQKDNHYIPIHTHDGVYSYTCWVDLPEESIFEFIYSSTIGISESFKIHLTPHDEGGIILFPALLSHCVHPFSENSKRISISGNIMLGANTSWVLPFPGKTG